MGSARWSSAAHAVGDLTVICDAMTSGQLSMPKLLELARFATRETEKQLASWAKRVSPRAIRRRADRANAPDPQNVTEAEDARFVKWWFDDHTMWLEGRFPAAQGAAIAKAVQRLADQLPDLPDEELPADIGPLEEVKVDQRRADALYLIASSHNANDTDEDRAAVVVHTKLADGEDHGWAELERSLFLPPEIARRISCDARLQPLVTGHDGDPLGIGRTSRLIPLWMERIVRHRDEWECTFLGCGLMSFLKSHHIRHWEHGGRTEPSNLVTVCHAHHKLVHEFGWRVALNVSRAEWYRPDGSRFDPGPDPPEQQRLGDPGGGDLAASA